MNISDKDRLSKPFLYNLLVIDNFYENPYDVREFALKQDFLRPKQVIPGLRTNDMSNIFNIKEKIQHIIQPYKIINFETTFQCFFQKSQLTFHIDSNDSKRLSGIIFLNPDIGVKYGTGLYKFKDGTIDYFDEIKTQFCEHTHSLHTLDKTLWTEITRIGNVFNRLVIFNGIYYHKPLDAFGNDIYDGRLTQQFTIDIE